VDHEPEKVELAAGRVQTLVVPLKMNPRSAAKSVKRRPPVKVEDFSVGVVKVLRDPVERHNTHEILFAVVGHQPVQPPQGDVSGRSPIHQHKPIVREEAVELRKHCKLCGRAALVVSKPPEDAGRCRGRRSSCRARLKHDRLSL